MNGAESDSDSSVKSDASQSSVVGQKCSVTMLRHRRMQDTDGRCIRILHKANEHFKAQEYGDVIAVLSEAIKARFEDKSDMLYVYTLLAHTYCLMKQYKRAYHCHKHELSLSRLLNNQSCKARVYANFAVTLTCMKRFSQAIRCTMRELMFYRTTENNLGESVTFHTLGCIYRQKAEHLGTLIHSGSKPITDLYKHRINVLVEQVRICNERKFNMVRYMEPILVPNTTTRNVRGKTSGPNPPKATNPEKNQKPGPSAKPHKKAIPAPTMITRSSARAKLRTFATHIGEIGLQSINKPNKRANLKAQTGPGGRNKSGKVKAVAKRTKKSVSNGMLDYQTFAEFRCALKFEISNRVRCSNIMLMGDENI